MKKPPVKPVGKSSPQKAIKRFTKEDKKIIKELSNIGAINAYDLLNKINCEQCNQDWSLYIILENMSDCPDCDSRIDLTKDKNYNFDKLWEASKKRI